MSGSYATVPGGINNSAIGERSFAAGSNAKANDQGTFVWADSQGTDFASTGINQFLIRAGGGVGINTPQPTQPLHLNVTQGEGMLIDSAIAGHSPAIYLNHTGTAGRNYRIASYGDNSTPGSFRIRDDTAGADRLTIDSVGNVAVAPPGSLSFGAQVRQMLNLWGTQYGIGVQSYTMYFRTDDSFPGGGFAWFQGGIHSNNQNDPGGGQTMMTLDSTGLKVSNVKLEVNPNGAIELGPNSSVGATPFIDFHYGFGSAQDYNVRVINDATEQLTIARFGSATPLGRFSPAGLTVNGAVVLTSDRSAKENFKPVSSREVLEKVASLPITRWSFKEDSTHEHIGPMAQDFYSAFALGIDDKHIATVDADGVALAAIQGLNQKLGEETSSLREQLRARDAEIAELRNVVTDLKKQIEFVARQTSAR